MLRDDFQPGLKDTVLRAALAKSFGRLENISSILYV
jgi:hypothetical protein